MNNGARPTEILKKEHEAVLGKLDNMERVIAQLDKREEIADKLKELAAFFKADFWVHFDKEEKALFPEFDNFMPRGAGPLAVMLDEHKVLRDTNAVMQRAIGSYLNHDDSSEVREKIRRNGSHFIETLRNHIFKEDNILFAMAEMHFEQAQNDKVVRLFAEIDKSKAG
ncbi:MAG: hemerythrin domain-containing protein [Chloroflexi bacterium]|nr:hemerythrin domain-containing protein [Chloroflexota bacterium]